MKKSSIFSLLLVLCLGVSQAWASLYDVEQEVLQNVEHATGKLERVSQEVKVLPYASLMFLQNASFPFPAVGLSFRYPYYDKIQYETDIQFASLPVSTMGSRATWIAVYKTSVAALPTLLKTIHGKVYAGLGGGVLGDFSGNFAPMVPLTLGYEGNSGFIDIGLDVVFWDGVNGAPNPTPAARAGLRF